MNLPNLLTILRILLAPLFVYLLIYGYVRSALAVFLVAGATDALDGAIARLCNQQTTLGRYLDPLADKILLTAAFISLGTLSWIPFWVLLIVISRDVILTLGTVVIHLTQGRVEVNPSLLGKATTVVQLTLIVLVLLAVAGAHVAPYVEATLWLTVVLTVASGFHYLYRGIRLLNGNTI